MDLYLMFRMTFKANKVTEFLQSNEQYFRLASRYLFHFQKKEIFHFQQRSGAQCFEIQREEVVLSTRFRFSLTQVRNF